MSYQRQRHLPDLRTSVDGQIEKAFYDGNWSAVVRHANQRSKTLKDPYYEVLKVCAESQLDSPEEKCAAILAVDALVRSGVTVLDVESLDLYEWACKDAPVPWDYSETIGVLRSKWVKANPRHPGAVSCLQACVRQWDLVNAQQIAATLDKSSNASGKSARRNMYWNIVLSYLLSKSSACPEPKQKIYGMLSLKQLEKAAELYESPSKEGKTGTAIEAKGMVTEEEFGLYLRLSANPDSREKFLSIVQSPKLGALAHFESGRIHLFLEAVRTLQVWKEWDIVFDICLKALSRTANDGSPSLLASNRGVWKALILAAGKQADEMKAFTQVQATLQRFVAISGKLAQMHVKNIGLAVVDLTFNMHSSMMPPLEQSSPRVLENPSSRVTQLCLFLEQHFSKASIFDDTKAYVQDLSFVEAALLVEQMLPMIRDSEADSLRRYSVSVLEQKYRYLLSTCPQMMTHNSSPLPGEPMLMCRICTAPLQSICHECLERIVLRSTKLYQEVDSDSDFISRIAKLDRDPRVDLSLVIAFSLLKLAGIEGTTNTGDGPMSRIDTQLFLQATIILDSQLHKTPDDTPLRLLVVLVYNVLGCASLAYHFWVPMDVKRTIQDALSPLFFDRMSSLSPGLFQGSRSLMEPLRSYFDTCLQDRASVKIWDAFEEGSYTSIIDMADFNEHLGTSCTRAMAAVEERRAARAFGGRLEDVNDVSVFQDVSPDTELINVTDYGSLPNFESSARQPLAKLLRLGPGLSNSRSHLFLLAERYLDLISFRPAKEYKPSKAASAAAADRAYTLESLATVNSSIDDFLHLPSTSSLLTPSEHAYFTSLSLLSAIALLSLTLPKSESLPPTFSQLTYALKSTLASQRATFSSAPPHMPQIPHYLTSLPTMSALRDTAIAIHHTTLFLNHQNDQSLIIDRSGKAAMHKETLVEMKAADALATKALGEAKARVKDLKEELGERGWLDRVADWTFGEGGQAIGDEMGKGVIAVVGGTAVVEEWIGRLVESWREGVKGWGMVKWE